MQNVVEVACSSPPVAMNTTKPAAQAVQAAGQDPFDLVLQQASERIVNNKQSDSANKSREFKSVDKNRGSDSTANEKTSQIKNESEVDRSNKSDRTQKSEKDKKSFVSEKSESDKRNTEKKRSTEAATDQAAMVFGVVSPVITTVENANSDLESMISEETSIVLTGEAVESNPEMGLSSTTDQDKANVSTDQTEFFATAVTSKETLAANVGAQTSKVETQSINDEDQVGRVAIEDTLVESQEAMDEAELKMSLTETQDKSTKVGDKASADPKFSAEVPNDTNEVSGKLTAETSSNTRGEEAKAVAQKPQEVVSPESILAEKTVKAAEVETNHQTAPPDNPNGTTAVTANATVQTTNQISEPARLAEAPKNEVITQVANQIDQLVKSNRSSIRLQLYPEELGHIDLRIVSTKSGISVTMMTEKASTQQVLKSDMDMLKQNIEQAGIQLSNLNINQGHNSNKQQSFDHRQNFSNSSHSGMNSDNLNQTANDAKVHLTSSLVDFKA